jgi:hypothetical protein
MMMMVMISPFGQLGLWAPSSGVLDVFTSITHGCFHIYPLVIDPTIGCPL